ncbi:hypothetical protein B0A48_12562 [Cryoendolithus antarcticus]|uniref:Transcription factor domain-containing protein n=1 Tax=Cryoendolithus antarcticus TaxID=1507870 RepID=A0A1V8SQR9_9PEZI|nr:hypothetical protein B0A48_12562 [Cryoendolithus antarcticus]
MAPFPIDRPVFVGMHLVPQAYFCRLADIAGKIPALDDLSIKGRSSRQACDMVLSIDQEFRELTSLAPMSWWDVRPNEKKVTLDLVLQYFQQYFTARAHMQLALHNDRSNTYAYSHMVCTEACRDLAVRYAALRPLVLGGFFPVRLFDVQALTAAIFLLHTCYSPGSSQGMDSTRTPPSLVLIQQVVDSMDLASKAIGGGHFAQEAARTIRSLSALLSNNHSTDSRYVSLRVPLLGRIHIRRQDPNLTSEEFSTGSSALPPQMQEPESAASMQVLETGALANAMPLDGMTTDPNSWLMEISGVLPFLSHDAHAPDQSQMLGDFDTESFGFDQV